jgi:hypothetical protein
MFSFVGKLFPNTGLPKKVNLFHLSIYQKLPGAGGMKENGGRDEFKYVIFDIL